MMKLILCLDDHGGMAFNKRRQTRDIVQRRHMNRELSGKTLYMSPYSAKLFFEDLTTVKLQVSDTYLLDDMGDAFVFSEREDVSDLLPFCDQLYIYRWNRSYPRDVTFPLDFLSSCKLIRREEFKGSSHDLITFEVYAYGK